MKKKTYDYAVMIISRRHNERRIAGFKAKNDGEARKKFKGWWPDGMGFLRYKLYRLVDMAAGEKKK